jgi:23S rRNA pseudouridine1911/1915/1917 synthase
LPEPDRKTLSVEAEDRGQRLDRFLVDRLASLSRAHVQQLISEGKVLVNGRARKASFQVHEGDQIDFLGELARPPLRAIAEPIPLEVIYEDDDLAVINKAAGMMVHAGAGGTDDRRNRGTLVNALLHRFGELSGLGGELRPGIVHRLDRATSGLMVVAKNDLAHRRLAEEFRLRQVKKTYQTLVHGWLEPDQGTVEAPISRDLVRRSRMTTRRRGGRQAVTHYEVEERLESDYGKFTLVWLRIATGRTHQIRVHMASLGHPVVGDHLYGAPREIRTPSGASLSLPRNFLHASELELRHPTSGAALKFRSPLPAALEEFLARLRASPRTPKRL